MTLTTFSANEFVSTSLDQSNTVWGLRDGKLKATLPGKQEPINCVEVNNEDIIMGTSSSRISGRPAASASSSTATIICRARPRPRKAGRT